MIQEDVERSQVMELLVPQNEGEERGLGLSHLVELGEQDPLLVELEGDFVEFGVSEFVVLEVIQELEIVFETG